MTPPTDLAELWRRLKVEGDLDAGTTICTRHLRMVRSLVTAIRRRFPTADVEELHGAGIVGLLEAVDRFDPSRGLRFTTFATPRIRGALLDSLRRQGSSTRGQRAVWRRLETAVQRVEQDRGERATPALIAAELRLPTTEYWRLRDCLGPVQVATPTEFEEPPSITDLPIDELIQEETRTQIREGIRRLPPRQRAVITRYFFKSMQLRAIGAALGVSESRVSQILRQAKEGLRCYLDHRWARDRDGDAGALTRSLG